MNIPNKMKEDSAFNKAVTEYLTGKGYAVEGLRTSPGLDCTGVYTADNGANSVLIVMDRDDGYTIKETEHTDRLLKKVE